jgi:DNA-binding LacI/PurR family transcriptional regulator
VASIRDVAKQAGVSPATVSRAFATPELINEQTQQRVFEAARLLGYRPPRLRGGGTVGARVAAAPRLRQAESPAATAAPLHDAIGFQFFSATPDDALGNNLFYAPVLAGAQAEAAALGLHLLVHSTDRHALADEMPRMVGEQAVGGLLLVGTADHAVLRALSAHVRQIVLVDNRDETGPYESVLSDGFGGAYGATRYLLKLGHRRIAFLDGEPGVPTFDDRRRGWLAALFEAGVSPDASWVLGGQEDDESRRGALYAALTTVTAAERPTAILAANDHNALHAIRACRDASLRIPADVSLVGFDDVYWAAHSDPPLTTVGVDKEYMGRLAVRLLHARLRGDGALGARRGAREPLPLRHVIPVSLVVRESCRPI